ncbi:hypothetical protein [Jeotgalibacillus soli]|uniref:Histidine kinase n=1 Tax=Jeotgalibacillus soli TaxID=889306 RepID=A0A0C2VL42_9BACL|nr:hypothetical protein [Jeotgalibacillus soli]KIL49612.1 hypothetical protein KP78_10800 [Jeotgalibacillus soli]
MKLIDLRIILNDGKASLYDWLLLLISLWYIIPKFNNVVKINKRVHLAILASLLGVFYMMVVIFLFFPEIMDMRYMAFLIIFSIAQSTGVILFVSFIEKARREISPNIQVRKLEKLKTVSEIAASISPKIRNPLTVTKGLIQLLRDLDLTEEKKNFYISFSL